MALKLVFTRILDYFGFFIFVFQSKVRLSSLLIFFLLFYFSLLSVLNVVAPSKHFEKMKEFIALKLPPGFPVKIGKYVLIRKVLTRKFY